MKTIVTLCFAMVFGLTGALLAFVPQDGPETQPPMMCHYDMSQKSEGGCSCAGQQHEKCGIDPETRRIMRDTRSCKAYCDVEHACHCCVS